MNPFVYAARLEKALKLVDVIDRNMRGGALVIDPHADALPIAKALRKWTRQQWAELAILAGCRPPSPETQAEVIRIYEERADEPSVEDSGVYQRRFAS